VTTPAAEQTQDQPAERKPDLEVIHPQPRLVTVNGIECRVKPIRVKAVSKIAAIMQVGVGPALRELQIDVTGGFEAVAPQILGLLLWALPNAIPEAVELVDLLVEPLDQDRWAELREYLRDDPDLGDLIEVIDAAVEQEQGNLTEIWGKARALVKRVAPLFNRTPKPSGSPASGSDGPSPRPTT
jgi:hypothetical protein